MMLFGLIFLVLGGLILLVLIIAVIAYFSGWRPDFLEKRSRPSSSSIAEDSSLDILQERYARGEINEEEYLQRKETLKS